MNTGKRGLLLFFSLLFSILVMGCASSGNQCLKKETESSVKSKITEGVTKKSEIKAIFGSPTTTSFTDAGKEIWKYHLDDITADAVNFIPFVNCLGSSTSGTRKELVILFEGETVQRYSMSESPVKTKTGIFR